MHPPTVPYSQYVAYSANTLQRCKGVSSCAGLHPIQSSDHICVSLQLYLRAYPLYPQNLCCKYIMNIEYAKVRTAPFFKETLKKKKILWRKFKLIFLLLSFPQFSLFVHHLTAPDLPRSWAFTSKMVRSGNAALLGLVAVILLLF